jgi:hypothetical protein
MNPWIIAAIIVVGVVVLVIIARKGERTPCGYENEQERRDALRASIKK